VKSGGPAGEAMNAPTQSSRSGMLLSLPRPYNFGLSLRVAGSFGPDRPGPDHGLRFAARIDGVPTLVEVSPVPGQANAVSVSSSPRAVRAQLRQVVEWVLVAQLPLRPFYRLARRDMRLSAIVRRLQGLKPTRPLSLFEMAVVAITEQQISLTAAYRIRTRLVERFGTRVQDQWLFPEPAVLAKATTRQLLACGLSRMKSVYIRDLVGKVVNGAFDFEALKTMSDEQARETIMGLKGFGPWSADYILVRGLARPDSVPEDDLGIRSVVGEYLGKGKRLSAIGVARKIEPFRPYRGLAAFYLLADHRLQLTSERPRSS
jgi:DNA-3-methyladenine glycosylase II